MTTREEGLKALGDLKFSNKGNGAGWAFRAYYRNKTASGEPLPPGVMQVVKAAIKSPAGVTFAQGSNEAAREILRKVREE